MKTIKFQNTTIRVTTAEEMALNVIYNSKCAVLRSALWTARRDGGWQEPLLDVRKPSERLKLFGVFVGHRQTPADDRNLAGLNLHPAKVPARQRRFFREHPRVNSAVFAQPRRVRALIKLLDRAPGGT